MTPHTEHPVKQKIVAVRLPQKEGWISEYEVGKRSVTHMEACEKSGPYTYIPYIRIWSGDTCLAEVCQHGTIAVYFASGEAK